VQLAGTQVSLTPLHSVTASALFTSLLSLHNNTWGVLSEGTIILFNFQCRRSSRRVGSVCIDLYELIYWKNL